MDSRPRYGALGAVVRSSLAGLLSTVLLAWQVQQSEGCRCLPQEFCENTSNMDIVVSGTILDRVTTSESSTYTVGVVDVYKADTDLPCGQNLEVKTATSSAACALNLDLYKDYVIGMYVLDDGSLSANSCGPTVAVENLTAEMIEVLENGGECIDPCANWACITLQECVVNEDGDPVCQYINGLESGEQYSLEDGENVGR